MKANFENSWTPHPEFEPRLSAQQAVFLPLDNSVVICDHRDFSGKFKTDPIDISDNLNLTTAEEPE